MKTVWKIWDNYNSRMLEGSYESKEKAEEAKERVTFGRKGRKEPIDLKICEAEYIVNHDYIYHLCCDLDRLEHFKKENNIDKIQEYLEIIASDVKRMLESEDELRNNEKGDSVEDGEIINAMNLIKEHCDGRICPSCACWNDEDNKCIVQSKTEPSSWKTEKAKIIV